MTPLSDKVFFSYATVAPMREASFAAAKTYLDEFYTYGPPDVLYKYDSLVDDMAVEAAKLINCDPSEVTSIKNTTEGVIIASEALPLKAGDEVLVLGNEYPANLLPWLKKQKDGVDVHIIPGTDSAAAFAQLLEKITPHTTAVSISAAQYYDGYMPDLEKLSAKCHDNDVFLVLDAVQAIGVRHIDVSKTPVDFLICGSQKYLMAGPGCGFLYVNKNVLGKLKDFKTGIRSMDHFDETSYVLKDNAGRFQEGTQNLAGVTALHAALKQINDVGIEVIEQKNYELLHDIKDCLRNYDIPFIDHGDRQSNIVSMQVADPKGLFEYLKERNVYIKAVKDVARLSFIHESTMEDVEIVARLTREWLSKNS